MQLALAALEHLDCSHWLQAVLVDPCPGAPWHDGPLYGKPLPLLPLLLLLHAMAAPTARTGTRATQNAFFLDFIDHPPARRDWTWTRDGRIYIGPPRQENPQ
jgi:hypothetical protein